MSCSVRAAYVEHSSVMAAAVVLSLLLLLPPLLERTGGSAAEPHRQEHCQTTSTRALPNSVGRLSTLRMKELFTTLAVQHKLLRCFNYQKLNQPIIAFAG
jgi:hypothetical protein